MWVEIAIARDSPIEYGVSRQITAKYWGSLVTQRVVMRIFWEFQKMGESKWQRKAGRETIVARFP
jgi:hypothetical protein